MNIFRRFTFFITLLFSLSLFGCAGLTTKQKNKVLDFSSGCSSLGNIVSQELFKMRKDVIEMNTYNFLLKGKPQLADRESSFTFDFISTRIQAAETLKSYGDLLETLMRTGEQDELERSIDSLNSNIENLNETDTYMVVDPVKILQKQIYLDILFVN